MYFRNQDLLRSKTEKRADGQGNLRIREAIPTAKGGRGNGEDLETETEAGSQISLETP